MTFKEVEASCSFNCAHCENSREVEFSNLKSHKSVPGRIWVRNLPNGISQSGLKNLFITVGKPKSINYYISNNSALVEFDCLRKCELALRDLHCKPPYNLNLTIDGSNTNHSVKNIEVDNWDFSNPPENVIENLFETKEISEEKNKELKAASSQSFKITSKLGYDPSIRMRQKTLDFKTDTKCVSVGRGYINMGKVNRYVNGLQNFKLYSENSKAKEKINFTCQYCQAPTTKMCAHCLKSFCSKVCLSKSYIDHQERCSALRSDNTMQSEDKNDSEFSVNQQNSCTDSLESLFSDVELTSGCSVIISTYLTMQSVFVRRSDKEWQMKFSRLCNDVAVIALKDNKLDTQPEINEIYIAKYYEDNCFYRAKIISVNQKSVEVLFVDFGNSQETKFEDLKPLPHHLKSVPELAVKVHLSDISEGSSVESVDYYNKLVAENILLILEFKEGSTEVVLKEKDSKVIVNETASNYILPSWKKDSSVISKLGEVFFKNSITCKKLKIGETYSLVICHFDEKEFMESEVLWAFLPDTDDFFHVNSEMLCRITEYCEFLKNDYYLPRTNELCLVKEEGKWQRCINLKSQGTTCYVFFVDDGHSSFIKTSSIRKMIQDFTEAPAQAICCTLPVDLKANKELFSKIVEYFKTRLGQRIDFVRVLKLMGDAYCLFIPEIQKILA